MATFFVNQRVRLVRYVEGNSRQVPLGTEGRIASPLEFLNEWGFAPLREYAVDFGSFGIRNCEGCQLAPLTDPKCTEFIERMKREFLNDRVKLLRIGNGALEHELRALYPDELDGILGGAA